jgi:Ricin-type beta-trefoil lectin domain
MHVMTAFALAAILAAVALAAVPSLASAQSLNSVAISTDASLDTLVLDVAGASTSVGAPVIQRYLNNGSDQRWNFVQLPDGNEHIVNQSSGMCLTTDGVAGDQVTQWTCNGSSQEEWRGTLPAGTSGGKRLIPELLPG